MKKKVLCRLGGGETGHVLCEHVGVIGWLGEKRQLSEGSGTGRWLGASEREEPSFEET